MLGARGTRAVYGSTIATPLRRLLTSSAPRGFSFVEVCGGPLAGARMHVDLSCEKYYWLGTHEEAVQAALCERVQRGDVAWDIGAHAGFFSVLLSRLVGDSGSVLAFEPEPENAARLVANLEANGCTNVEVHAAAVSDAVSRQGFARHQSSLEGALTDTSTQGGTVTTTTIDAIVASGAPAPSIMKIDVEGAEGRVIAGGRRTIAAHRPAITIEVHSPAAWGDVLDALPVPYSFTDIEPTQYRSSLRMPGHYLGMAAAER
jgi:FkbM family methyltransferase